VPSDRSQEHRDQLRQEGNDRNESWRSLSYKQQLKQLKKRRGESKKQVARIKKLMEKETTDGRKK